MVYEPRSTGIPLDIEQAEALVRPHTARFLDPLHTNALGRASISRVENGDHDAYFVPAVKFVIDASLIISNKMLERKALPREVVTRALYAADLASMIADMGVERGIFTEAYRRSPYLKSRLDNFEPHLTNTRYMRTLGSTTFTDTARVAGGAFRFLGEQGLGESAPATVANSSGLLVVAGIGKKKAKHIAHHLGTPYVRSQHLEITNSKGQPQVSFTPASLTYIKRHLDEDRGCPARKIRSVDGGKETIMRQGFHDIVAYLLAEGATTNRH